MTDTAGREEKQMETEMQELLKSLEYSGGGNGHLNTLCARAAMMIRQLSNKDLRGWLIETARNEYWNGRHIGDDAVFISSANDACRFARFEDAELVRCWLLEKDQRPQRLRSSEHIFIRSAKESPWTSPTDLARRK